MMLKGKFIVLLQVTFQVFGQSVKAIDDDSFDLYDENSDGDLRETSQDGTEDTQPDPEPKQIVADDATVEQKEVPKEKLSETPEVKKETNPLETKRNDEEELSKKAMNQERMEQQERVRKDFHIITCLAMYSKSANDKMTFQNKIEEQFAKADISDNQQKQRLVERYVVNAIHECSLRTKAMPIERLQVMMKDTYSDSQDKEVMNSFVVFNENIIMNKEYDMSADEKKTSEEMKRIQQEHGQQNNDQVATRASMTETYGEWSLLLICVIVACVIYYLMSGSSKEALTESKIKVDIRSMKKERKNQVEAEKILKVTIQDLKKELNDKKKSK